MLHKASALSCASTLREQPQQRSEKQLRKQKPRRQKAGRRKVGAVRWLIRASRLCGS